MRGKDIRFGKSAQQKKQILVRPRVNQLLEAAAEHSLVTVTAGTGYGKSQAVFSYLESQAIPYFWLQLTGLDNYPMRFWDIFCQSVGSHNGGLAKKMQVLGFPDSLEKTYNFLRLFAGEIYTKGRCVLVLDDFHRITDASIIHFVETLSFTGIENLTIILIARTPLMLDYSGLQTRNIITNVGVAELRFTPQEANDYYALAGLDLPEEMRASIYQFTEGWPLAIYLIALHYQRQGGLFEDPVECTIPLLYTLIEQELFNDYPPAIQDVFIKLSIMENVPFELVQVLSGHLYADVAALLRQNMFVTYNSQTGNYHLHRLFRHFLRGQQVRFSDEQLGRIYLTIGDWYRDENKPLEALFFYDKCENNARCWQVIRQFGSNGFNSALAALCISQLDKFSPEYIEENPLVLVMRAYLLLNTGEIELAYRHNLELKEDYESRPSTPQRQAILGEVYIQLAHISIMKCRYDFVDYYRKAAQCLPEGSAIIQRHQFYVGSNSALNLFSPKAGELERYVDAMMEIMPTAVKAMNGCGAGAEFLAASEAAMVHAEYGEAIRLAGLAIETAEAYDQFDIIFNAVLIILRVNFCQGNYEETFRQLDQMRYYADKVEDQNLYGMNDIAEGWLYAHLGHTERVANWILSGAPVVQGEFYLNIGKEKIVHATCLLHNKEYYELLALLDFAEKRYAAQGLHLLVLHTYILRAITHHKLGDGSLALNSFRKAYRLACANNIIMPFVEYDSDMRSLIEFIRPLPDTGIDDGWLAAIHAKSTTYSKKRAIIAREFERINLQQSKLYGSLTTRETEVLAVLCKGFTREEIAAHFSISINTVKTTLKNIFSKLGAINRADAIRIAKDYHLIE